MTKKRIQTKPDCINGENYNLKEINIKEINGFISSLIVAASQLRIVCIKYMEYFPHSLVVTGGSIQRWSAMADWFEKQAYIIEKKRNEETNQTGN